MNLFAFDMNLLKVLDALLTEHSTVGAAERVGLSQPAVSAALGRLRAALGDPLFVRQGQHLVPTPYAEGLAAPLAAALDGLGDLLSPQKIFDPATAEVSFVVTASDFYAELLMPSLARAVAKTGITMRMIDLRPGDHLGPLREGTADLTILPEPLLGDWPARLRVFLSPFAVIARSGHPALAGTPPPAACPLDVFCESPHVVYSADGGVSTRSDEILAATGRTRRVVMSLPHFAGLHSVVAGSDLLAVVPAKLALSLAGRYGIGVWRLPFDFEPLPIALAWAPRTENSAAHRWLRATVAGLLSNLPELAP